ncbi:MAG: dimethylsulfonioproprionate lyase family protein [Kiloniellales bacterium]
MTAASGAVEAATILARAARAVVAAAGHPSVPVFLSDWPSCLEGSRRLSPASLSVLRWLPDLPTLASAATLPLVELLVQQAASLTWKQSYDAADFGPQFLERYGWSELFGARGPIAAPRLACGFLLLGPESHYPRHRHEAEELYLPLAGTAQWQKGDRDRWQARAAGTPIHHPAWTSHALRTGAEPLLALYLWRAGDLTQKSMID